MSDGWLLVAVFVVVMAFVVGSSAWLAARRVLPLNRLINADIAALRNADPDHVAPHEWWRL